MAIKESELNTVAVELHGISKRFGQPARRPFSRGKPKKEKLALDQVSMHVDTGRISIRLRRREAARRRSPPHQPRLGRGIVLQRDESVGEHALRGAPLWQRW